MIHGSELISVYIAQAGYVDLQGGDGGGGDAGHIPAGVRIISVTLFVKCRELETISLGPCYQDADSTIG